MKRHSILMIVALVSCLLPGQVTAAMASPLTLIYGNDVRGELAPCG